MKNNHKSLVVALLAVIVIIGAGIITRTKADVLPNRNYKGVYYPGSNSWCCFDGKTGCIPLNCPE